MRALILLVVFFSFVKPLVYSDILKYSIDSYLSDHAKEHPRLFLKDKQIQYKKSIIEGDDSLKQLNGRVIEYADHLLTQETIKRDQVGRRMLGTARKSFGRIIHLAYAFRMTKDKKYVLQAQNEMLAAAKFKDWNPRHFLDVAEMTTGMAIGYDWLYEQLDPKIRKKIRKAIVEKGLKASLKEPMWWVKANFNWNQVCHGGLVIGALAVLEDERDLAETIIRRAIKYVPNAMSEYAPHGAYPEGPSYWVYGTSYNVLLIDALESVLKSDFNLARAKGFMESSDYYLHTAGPTQFYFNYSDGGLKAGMTPIMVWFANKRQKPSLLWREHKMLSKYLSKKRDKMKSNRMLPFYLIWSKPKRDIPKPQSLHWKGGGATSVAVHRTAWDNPKATFIGIKGGSPSASHAHMDIGSFVIDAAGKRWAHDLGPQSYYDLESKGVSLWDSSQGSQRWDVFRLSNLSHNTLVVDGQKQKVDGNAKIIKSSQGEQMPFTVLDMSSSYKGQLVYSKRGIAIINKESVLIQDELRTMESSSMVRWGMLTKAEIEIVKEGKYAQLKMGDEVKYLSLISPSEVKFEIYETAKPPEDYDALNPGTRMIGFRAKVKANHNVRFAILFSSKMVESLQLKSLRDW